MNYKDNPQLYEQELYKIISKKMGNAPEHEKIKAFNNKLKTIKKSKSSSKSKSKSKS
jgi:hypothetical protein